MDDAISIISRVFDIFLGRAVLSDHVHVIALSVTLLRRLWWPLRLFVLPMTLTLLKLDVLLHTIFNTKLETFYYAIVIIVCETIVIIVCENVQYSVVVFLGKSLCSGIDIKH